MNRNWVVSRRALLGGVAASVAASLAGTRKAHAQMVPPKRLVIFFTPNGTIGENWRPAGTESAFTLSTILAPLQPIKSKLLILNGVNMSSTASGIGDGHQKGMCHMLTAVDLMPGPFPGGGSAGPAGYAGGISVDQHIANAIGSASRFRSLEFGVSCGGASNWSRMAYRAANQPIPPMENPYDAFTRVFAGVGMDSAEIRARLARRQSVLDNSIAEMASLRGRLGADDQARLDAYQEALRDIERRLSAMAGATCAPPTLGTPVDRNLPANYPIIGRLHMDLMFTAFQCGLTKVASIQWSRSVGQPTFPWLGISDRHHDLSHIGDSDTVVRDKITRINRWYSEQFLYLAQKFEMQSEGTGTMLDNTVMLWCNELGRGNSHSPNSIPWVLAGNAGGYFRTGRYLSYTNASHSNLLVSVCNAMGVPTTTFGNPRFCTGVLPNLR